MLLKKAAVVAVSGEMHVNFSVCENGDAAVHCQKEENKKDLSRIQVLSTLSRCFITL